MKKIVFKKPTVNFFPGRKTVSFRRGPSGFLRQDPSDEATRIKNNPHLQDKSPPQLPDIVKTNALTVVRQQGGDASNRQEVMGEYILQFGKYKGKSYRWLLENDVGYIIYLMKQKEEEEKSGLFNPTGPKKDSLLSLLEYAMSFKEIEDLMEHRKPVTPVTSEGDNLVGFGKRAKDTWKEIWDSRADGYAKFILGKNCVKNSKMYNLQQFLLKQQRAESSAEPCISGEAASTTSETSKSTSGTLGQFTKTNTNFNFTKKIKTTKQLLKGSGRMGADWRRANSTVEILHLCNEAIEGVTCHC